MKNMTKLLMYMSLLLSIIIMMSSNNWFSMWISLEINLIMFIPIINKNNYNSSKSMMIYFFIQSLSSMIFIFSIIMLYKNYLKNMINLMMMMSLMMKMGIPPLHFWLPMMMENLMWMNSLILMTLQKIIPMTIMTYINNNMMYLIVMISSIISAIGGLNETSLQKIMAYSSMNHSSWMLISMKFENKLWMIYLTIYSIMITMIIIMLNMNSIFFINQMMLNLKFMEKISITIMFMSLGSLPPFLGFIPKWMIIQYMMYYNYYLIMLIMIMMSLIILYYYMQISLNSMLINYNNNKWKMNMKKNNLYIYMLMINIMMPIMYMMKFI